MLKRFDDVRKAAQTLFECRFVRGEGQAYVSLARRAEFGPGAYEHASGSVQIKALSQNRNDFVLTFTT